MHLKENDRVRHSNKVINGGVDMPILKISNGKALCPHLDQEDKSFKDDWFNLEDLVLVKYGPANKR